MLMQVIGNGYLLSEEEITEKEYRDVKRFLTDFDKHYFVFGQEVFIKKDGGDIIKTIFS